MGDTIYVKETKEFIVNDNVIKETSLTEAEKKKLKECAKEQSLLTGEKSSEGTPIF